VLVISFFLDRGESLRSTAMEGERKAGLFEWESYGGRY
jgi:hypothetical protein